MRCAPSTLNAPLSTRFIQDHAYWGPSFTTAQCKAAAAKYPVTVEELPDSELFDRVVDAMCDGKVIGWFQGRMEFGARALGCRSLIADPRRTDMRDIINLKIKFREKFRPFAPSILAETVSDWFEINEPSPYMEKVLPIRKEKHSVIPAVTHVDGTGRLQSVNRETNPRYYELIQRFYKKTGVPIILNTSLNENEPIVHTPEQAIECYLRTKMDFLVLENLMLSRS
jgi:carbamoyltransferase